MTLLIWSHRSRSKILNTSRLQIFTTHLLLHHHHHVINEFKYIWRLIKPYYSVPLQFMLCIVLCIFLVVLGAQWLNGRVLDSRPSGSGFEPHRRHCVVSLSKNINPSLVLVQPRKTRPFITERLLMGCKESNQTKQNPHGVWVGLNVAFPFHSHFLSENICYMYCYMLSFVCFCHFRYT